MSELMNTNRHGRFRARDARLGRALHPPGREELRSTPLHHLCPCATATRPGPGGLGPICSPTWLGRARVTDDEQEGNNSRETGITSSCGRRVGFVRSGSSDRRRYWVIGWQFFENGGAGKKNNENVRLLTLIYS